MGKTDVNLERVFDLVVHMRENPTESYKINNKVSLTPEQQGRVLKKSIQAFFQKVGKMEGDRVIQAFSGSSDLPVLTKDVFNVSMAMPVFDTLWQRSFKGVPLRKGQLSWEIADVAEGLTFRLVPEGGKADIYGVSGNKILVGIEKYGAGLGVTWEMTEGRKLYQFVDQMNAVRAKLNDLWADIHYGLLATAGATNPISYQLTTSETTLERDIATINKGYETIGEACKEKGYGDTANSQMILYVSPKLKSRISQALRVTSSDLIRSSRKFASTVDYGVTLSTTWNSAIPANKGILVLPGNKIQNAVYLRELGLTERDVLSLSELKVYWTAFGATVADSDQTVELSFA